MEFKRKPEIVEAVQWFKDGDHPDVTVRDWSNNGEVKCIICGRNLVEEHGNILMQDMKRMVCPGDYIVTHSTNGPTYPCRRKAFEERYEKAQQI